MNLNFIYFHVRKLQYNFCKIYDLGMAKKSSNKYNVKTSIN